MPLAIFKTVIIVYNYRMYCPVCFNDTLKISSSGVVKFSFNAKAKSTSQLYYNLSQDNEKDLLEKLDNVIKDYFIYYSAFQNKYPIRYIEAFSIDFKCSSKCIINLQHKVSVIGSLFSKKELHESLRKLAPKYSIEVHPELC